MRGLYPLSAYTVQLHRFQCRHRCPRSQGPLSSPHKRDRNSGDVNMFRGSSCKPRPGILHVGLTLGGRGYLDLNYQIMEETYDRTGPNLRMQPITHITGSGWSFRCCISVAFRDS
jgi:hypothetical protein